MGMSAEILSAIKQNEGEPPTSQQIVDQVRERSGMNWKGASIRKSLGRLVAKGEVVNLDRDPFTGYYRRIPCRYSLSERSK